MRRLGGRACGRSLALLAALGVVLLAAAPAAAQSGQQSDAPQAWADAGAGLAVIRVAGAAETGFGLAASKVDSRERDGANSVAESSPIGLSVQGNAAAPPGSLVQAAPPDNERPKTQDFGPPASPADQLLELSVAKGSVHARWHETRGPCVEPLNVASTSAADVSAVNVIPSLPSVPGLPGLPAGTPTMNAQQLDALRKAAEALQAPLSQLGGLLTGGSNARGAGSLVRLPDISHASTEIKLVDVPGQAGKGVQAISRVQFASVRVLAGTPFELEVGVVSQPTLAVTSTGDPKTAKVEYTAPVLVIKQGGREVHRLDAAHPTFDLRMGLLPPSVAPPELSKLPIIGNLLPDGQQVGTLPVIDIGLLRLSIGKLVEQKQGAAVGALARLMDIQLLPTDKLPLPGLPAALAQITFGEHAARAAAPAGGVLCQAAAPAPNPPAAQPRPQPPLAFTSGAYHMLPLTIIGGSMLLIGTVLVAALPASVRRRDEPDPPV